MADPEARERYTAALKARVSREDAPTPTSGRRRPKCLICGSKRLSERKVVYVHNEPVLPSIGHYVLISPSAKNGISVGDEVTVIDNSTGREESDPAPPVVAGVGQVVRVTPFAATAIIVRQAQPTIRDGMPVRMTGKMP